MERTWWIFRGLRSIEPMIGDAHRNTQLEKLLMTLSSIGPYWSYEEAQRVLDHWMK